jgi:hypothetical protein
VITLLGGKCAPGGDALAGGERASVVQSFEENGCTLSAKDTQSLFSEARQGRGDGSAVIEMLMAGEISVDKTTRQATLVAGTVCGAAPDTRSVIISIFEANNCRMTEDQAMTQFPAAGLDLERDEDVVDAMFEAGELIDGDGNSARLVIGDKCMAEANVVKDAVIAAFAANDCVLTEDTFEAALAGGSIDVDEAGELVEEMMESGEVVYDKSTKQARLMIGDACTQ